MGLLTYLRRLDIFGVPITFVGFNRLKYQTKLGGLVSLSLVGWLMYNIVLQFVSLISKNKMTVTTNTIFNDVPPLIQINSENFMFALQIQQTDYINNPYFTFKVQHYSVRDGVTGEVIDISLAQCTLDDFKNLYYYNTAIEDALIFNDYKNWVCPQFGDQTYNLQGKYGSSLFQYFKISIYPCQPEQYDINYTCPTYTSIVDFVNSIEGELNINIMVTNLNIDTTQTQSYTGFLDREYYMLLNPLMQFGSTNMFLRNWNVYTNPSIIDDSTTYDYQNYIIQDRSETTEKYAYRQYNETSDNEIAKIFFRNSQYSFETQRNYVSIGDFLAYVGGIFGSLYTIGSAFMQLYAYEQLWLKLFKVYYNLIQDEKECKSLDQIIQDKFSQNNILRPNMKSFLWFFTKQGRQNIKTYIQSQSIIMEDLSIVNYFQTVKDLQKIKKIIFNEKQTQIIEMYNKETIVMQKYETQHAHKLEQGKKYLYGQKFQDHTQSLYKKIIDQYQSLLYEKDKFQLKITQRIINIFDFDLQEVINTWENGYYQLKTIRTQLSDIQSPIRLQQKSQQFAISKDITKIINFNSTYNLTESEIDSLIKTSLFKQQAIQICENITIQYECQILEQNNLLYILTIYTNYQQYELNIKQSDLLISHNHLSRKHKIVCKIQKLTNISLQELIDTSLEIKINDIIIYLNCSLISNIDFQEKINNLPKEFRTQFHIYLDQKNSIKYENLMQIFQNKKIKIQMLDNVEFILNFDKNIFGSQYIQMLLNWPNNDIILNEQILKKTLFIQFLQLIYDIIICYLQVI